MARKLQSDKWMFLATLALLCVSVVMVYSASALVALERYQQPYLFVTKQVMWAAFGVALLSVVMRVDYRMYRNERLIWVLLGIVGLLLVAVLFARPVNGTKRWFAVAGFGIQPSELAKLAAIFFTALMLERRMHRINEVRYALLPIGLIVAGLLALILLEPDFGTAVSLLAVVGIMIFAAGLSYKYLIGAALLMIPVLGLVLIQAPYRVKRILIFLDPWADPLGDGFQIIQSLIAVGTGGVFGKGLMAGVQKLFYLPEPHTDFIYAVIAEETGLVGSVLILACFAVIAWRGMHTALRAPDRFGAFLALGLTMMLVLQAFVNISVVLGLMPTKGIPAAARERRRVVAAHQPCRGRGAAEHLAARGYGDGSGVTGARADRRRGDGWASLPGRGARARAAATRCVDRDHLRGHGDRHRDAGDPARGIPAGSDPRGGAEGHVAAESAARRPDAAAGGDGRMARDLEAPAIGGGGRGRVLVGPGAGPAPRSGGGRRSCSSRTPCPVSPTGCSRPSCARRP